MTYLYLPSDLSAREIVIHSRAFEQVGYTLDQIQINPSFSQFARAIPEGSTVVVYSLDFFSSLIDLLTSMADLSERSITLRSLQDPWLEGQVGSTADFLERLRQLAVAIHQNRTRKGLDRARSVGKRLGRPAARTRSRGSKTTKS